MTRCAEERDGHGPCTLPREPGDRSLDRPWVMRTHAGGTDFVARTEPNRLRRDWGSVRVTLSSANTFSYGRVESTLGAYLDSLTADGVAANWTSADTASAGMFYWFGEHSAEWEPLLREYDYAPLLGALKGLPGDAEPPEREPALSFGIGAHMSGVPFHQHGAGFSESLHGHKRWLFVRDGHEPPRWLPNATSAYWLAHELPALTPAERALVLDCTIGPGEAVYFPAGWCVRAALRLRVGAGRGVPACAVRVRLRCLHASSGGRRWAHGVALAGMLRGRARDASPTHPMATPLRALRFPRFHATINAPGPGRSAVFVSTFL